MREFLFRGQTRRKGEKVRMDGTPVDSNWVYGGVFQGSGSFSIIYSYSPIEKFSVYTDTLGQYTGRADKNCVKIFENDCVKTSTMDKIGVIRYGKYNQPGDSDSGGHIGFYVDWLDDSCYFRRDLDYWANMIEVVGNIHDDPDLLEEAGKND